MGGRCQVVIHVDAMGYPVARGRECGSRLVVREYHGRCGCGHEVSGLACLPCLDAVTSGCLGCWEVQPGRHVCPVALYEPSR